MKINKKLLFFPALAVGVIGLVTAINLKLVEVPCQVHEGPATQPVVLGVEHRITDVGDVGDRPYAA